MIPNEDFRAWLATSPAEKRHHSGAPAERPAAQPALAALAARLDRLPADAAEDAADAVAAFLSDDRWLATWLDDMAAASRADPYHEHPLNPFGTGTQTGCLLLRHPRARISLGVIGLDALAAKKRRESAQSITFSGAITLQKFLKAGDAVLDFWHAPAADADFSLDAPMRCRPGARHRVADGDLLRFDGACDGYVIAGAKGSIVLLQAEITAGQAPLSVEYDSVSGQPAGVASTDDGASRAQMLLSFLRGLGRPGDAEVIDRFTRDPQFFVRWHAVRELLALSPERGLVRLHAMAVTDPHAELRDAAAATLAAMARTEKGAPQCRN